MNEAVMREVWVRCGGRCVICNEWMLTDHLDERGSVRRIGEVAHIAAQSEKGPRGKSRRVALRHRDTPENLILLCPTHHTTADKRLIDAQFTEDYLIQRKRVHEAFVKHATGLRDRNRTVVLRMRGEVGAAPGMITVAEAAAATMNSAGRVPEYLPDPRGHGLEIDLSSIPNAGSSTYWKAACRQIDAAVARFHDAGAQDIVDHVSVFAIARLPLLIYLGHQIDDTISLDVYERHRDGETWNWDPSAPTHDFESTRDASTPVGEELVLVVNASGTIPETHLPANLQHLPVVTLQPTASATPGKDTFRNKLTLDNFAKQVRALLSELETDTFRNLRVIHLLAAMPVSAAVTLGRQMVNNGRHPTMRIYQRDPNGTFLHALDLGATPAPGSDTGPEPTPEEPTRTDHRPVNTAEAHT